MTSGDEKGLMLDDLIALLQDRRRVHGNVEVLLTWESVVRGFGDEEIYIATKTGALMIDADGGSYKGMFIKGILP